MRDHYYNITTSFIINLALTQNKMKIQSGNDINMQHDQKAKNVF